MVQIQIRYEGGLRCKATHGPSGQTLLTDAPVDNQGQGESFSPTDLLATSVGTCMLTIMGIVAERHGWDLVGSEVIVEKKMVAEPTRRIGELDVVIRVPADLDDNARAALERAAGTCPVHASLGPDVSVPVRFEWGVTL
ncbi:MAG: OsmC family peroxiredoxin [Planctomycetota bacterium]|nr:MAG: OsmC family peroxiredoxin [Planctomycetota bacterium]